MENLILAAKLMWYGYGTSKLGFITVSKIFTCIDVIKLMPRLTWLTIGND